MRPKDLVHSKSAVKQTTAYIENAVSKMNICLGLNLAFFQ